MYPETFKGYAVLTKDKWETPAEYEFKPQPFGPRDIDIKIHACGVCGSDLHSATGGWGNSEFPLIPGHEIIGEAIRVGDQVKSVKVGDRVGVGAQVLSCMECDDCKNDNETYCAQWIDTYGARYQDGTLTQGGYASHIRAHEHFVFPIPATLDTATTAPFLCGGITVYSPLKRNAVGPGSKVGIIGIGGLGHFAVMLAAALGAEVWAISHTSAKRDDALALGATGFLATADKDWNKDHRRSFDFLLSTASAVDGFNIGDYLALLKTHCKFVSVGLPEQGWMIKPQDMNPNGCFIGSSHLGSRRETLEMLKLVEEKGLKAWVEEVQISPENIGAALVKLHNGKPRYRQTLVGFDKAFGN
ncbi:hypothetical protein TD95_003824 [Thielaviopsis punctulata]|uniref:alcohol dehydrogenase (NADP(+)) n=1 Tax=Thielaviopsis punctulata TaxID=72032 RepID=A0A0F4ZIG1_9PEZI|nr:hypothetical protein TD95_003824 [Thielaviopsis punctulata]